MKQPDSPKFPTRRTLLQAGIAAAGLFANPFAALAAVPPGFDQWRDARARWQRHFGSNLDPRDGRIEPDERVPADAEAAEFRAIWQCINRRASDWRIINGRER
jgi:hypothetical protein